MAKSLGVVVNTGLRTIGETAITAFTTTNFLQQELIEAANESVHDLLEAARYRWGLFYDGLATIDAIDGDEAAVTADSTAVTSVDEDGVNAQSFTGSQAGDWFRVTGDDTSYRIASVDLVSDPNTLVLEDAYLGATSTATAYKIIRDTFPVSTASLDEIIVASYGDGLRGRLKQTNMQNLMFLAGGDLHRNTGGYPTHFAQVGPDSSDNPQFLFWPYPNYQFLISLWYTLKFTSNTTFATSMFGANAPDIAYDAVQHRVRWRACLYDNDRTQANDWMMLYQDTRGKLVARENRENMGGRGMQLETGRTFGGRKYGFRVESQILFDRT